MNYRKKIFQIVLSWIYFTLGYIALAVVLVVSASPTPGDGLFALSARDGFEILLQMYGIQLYLVLPILLIAVRAFQFYKKKK